MVAGGSCGFHELEESLCNLLCRAPGTGSLPREQPSPGCLAARQRGIGQGDPAPSPPRARTRSDLAPIPQTIPGSTFPAEEKSPRAQG